jgi:putative thioredoxin
MKSAHVIDVNEASFARDVVEKSRSVPVVVDFWAPWCGPCRTLGPLLERLAGEYAGRFVLAKINSDENQRLAGQFGIQGIPAVKAFRDGKVVAEFVGAQPEPQVRQFLKKVVPDGAAAGGDTPAGLLAAHRWAEAEAAYRRAVAAAPGQGAAALGLARAALAQGKGAEAAGPLAGITAGPELAAAEQLRPLVSYLSVANTVEDLGGSDSAAAHFFRAARSLRETGPAAALEELLIVLRRDKNYRSGEPRRVMLALFAVLGDEDAVTRQYRSKLAAVLF